MWYLSCGRVRAGEAPLCLSGSNDTPPAHTPEEPGWTVVLWSRPPDNQTGRQTGRCNERMRTRMNCSIFELMLENSPWSPQRSSGTSPSTLPSPGRSQKSWPGPPLHTNTAHLSTHLWKHLCPSECHIYCVWLRTTRLTLHGSIDVAPVGEDNVHVVQLQPGERTAQACNTHTQHRGIRCNNWINVRFIFSSEGQTHTAAVCLSCHLSTSEPRSVSLFIRQLHSYATTIQNTHPCTHWRGIDVLWIKTGNGFIWQEAALTLCFS